VTDADRNDSAPEPKGPRPLIIIMVVVVVALLSCVCIGVLVTLASARKSFNEVKALESLRAIAASQAEFREGDKDKNGKKDFAASLKALGDAQLIDAELASGTKLGYLFTVRTGNDPLSSWSANANPADPKAAGARWFFIDQTGVIRYSMTGPADETSEQAAGFH
jgi:hypothetical protein